MPDQCTTEVASAAAARTAAGCLLPSRLQRSSRIGATDVAEQENIVCALVRSHGRYFIGSGSESEASRCEIGFFGILHTWGQTLQQHPHIHCVVPGGGLSPQHTHWISSRSHFFLPVKVLSRVFRGKFCAGLRRAFHAKQLAFFGECLPLADESNFSRFLRTLFQQDWVVYSKPPFGGPDHVLQYLARYTHRVAISNHRIVSVTDSEVRFRWRDYANHNKKRTMTLTGAEFLRRFLQHVLPKGFPRIRYFGWFANRKRGPLLQLCRVLLNQRRESAAVASDQPAVQQCPKCHGPMRTIERLSVEEIKNKERSLLLVVDTC